MRTESMHFHSDTKNSVEYNKLFLAGISKGIGERFFQVAMLSLVVSWTNSGMAVGGALALRLLPFLFLAPISGWLLTYIPHRKMLTLIDYGRAMIALLPFLIQDKQQLWILFLVQVLLSCGEAMYVPVRRAAIPLLAERSRLSRVNSQEQLLTGIVLIFGSLTGGIISYFFGYHMAFALHSALFLLSGWIQSTIQYPRDRMQVYQDQDTHIEEDNLIEQDGDQLKSGLRGSRIPRILLYSVPLQVIVLFELLIPIPNGVDNVLISMYAQELFHMGELGIGILYGALGLGLFLSFFVFGRVKQSFMLWGLVCLGLEGMMLVIVSYSSHFILVAFLYVLQALFSGISNAALDTELMRRTPIHQQGVMFGMLASISNTLLGLSMFMAGIWTDYIPLRELGRWAGAAYVLIAVVLFLYSEIRQYKRPKSVSL